jgi:putative glutamine amidotransferase
MPVGNSPVIGITCPSRPTKWANWDLDAVVLPTTYHKMVMQCGGIPLLIPPGCSSEVMNRIDGLIISGGPDINPQIYGQNSGSYTNEIYPTQDASEIELIKSAIEKDIPLLCICRGFQLLCAINGGELHQHLPETVGYENHGGWNGRVTEHGVDIIKGTKLEKIMGTHITANSTHHQGVSNAGNLLISAYSSHDNLIEAVEIEELRFCIGVQWHPERIKHTNLYLEFIETARGSSL